MPTDRRRRRGARRRGQRRPYVRAISLLFTVVYHDRHPRSLVVVVIEEHGIGGQAPVFRFNAAYAQHKTAGTVIAFAQVGHLYRTDDLFFRRSLPNPLVCGSRCRHGRRDIGFNGGQILGMRARRERETKQQHQKPTHIERRPLLQIGSNKLSSKNSDTAA
jgi:hypothetical protein